MKSILISIKPEWTAKILNGEKTIEIRKTAPKCELPVDVYIYCTKGDYIGRISNKYVGKVVAKFKLNFCDSAFFISKRLYAKTNKMPLLDEACVSLEQLEDYCKGRYNEFFFWFIHRLEIFDQPKDLSEFGLKRAPQSWQYVEEE